MASGDRTLLVSQALAVVVSVALFSMSQEGFRALLREREVELSSPPPHSLARVGAKGTEFSPTTAPVAYLTDAGGCGVAAFAWERHTPLTQKVMEEAERSNQRQAYILMYFLPTYHLPTSNQSQEYILT
ncbi:hypothetical protein STEG23_018820 [Scotinomys teguina]